MVIDAGVILRPDPTGRHWQACTTAGTGSPGTDRACRIRDVAEGARIRHPSANSLRQDTLCSHGVPEAARPAARCTSRRSMACPPDHRPGSDELVPRAGRRLVTGPSRSEYVPTTRQGVP